jgi:hypothetical protein
VLHRLGLLSPLTAGTLRAAAADFPAIEALAA